MVDHWWLVGSPRNFEGPFCEFLGQKPLGQKPSGRVVPELLKVVRGISKAPFANFWSGTLGAETLSKGGPNFFEGGPIISKVP